MKTWGLRCALFGGSVSRRKLSAEVFHGNVEFLRNSLSEAFCGSVPGGDAVAGSIGRTLSTAVLAARGGAGAGTKVAQTMQTIAGLRAPDLRVQAG